jgi:hypothetical protein
MEDSYDDQYLEAGGHFEDYNLDPTDGASGIVAVRLCSVFEFLLQEVLARSWFVGALVKSSMQTTM